MSEQAVVLSHLQIRDAWVKLEMPELYLWKVVYDHGLPWVTGYDDENDTPLYVVKPSSGDRSYNGIAFEQC